MRHYSRTGRTLCAALSITLMFPLAATAQPRGPPRPVQAPDKELIAVLELEAAGTDRNLATALTDSLRESLLKTGRFTLVDRAQIDDIIKEQAFQQTGCTTQECAVQVGKVLGVRTMVSGRVVRLDATHWRLSVSLLDVETAQTVRTESVTHTGDFVSLVERATQPLAERLATPGPGERAPMVPPPAPVAQPAAPRPPEPPPQEAARTPEPSNPARPWVLTGFSLALAAGAVTEAQAVTASNNNQKDLAAQAKLATTQVQYKALLSQIADEKKKGQDAATLSNELAVGSVLLAAWAIYLAVRAPEKVAALRIVPVPDGTGGGRLLLVRTW